MSVIIDLRSDTVTLPTKEMLESIQHAKLGDDVYGEDSTVKELEEIAAEKMDKDAALLVTSGTQANLVSIMSNTKQGDSIILEADSHIYWYEVGGISAIGGRFPIPVLGELGVLDPRNVEDSIRRQNVHFPETRLICIENTHNRAGGTIINPIQIQALNEVSKKNDLKLYMDGARIFNAAIALSIDVKKFTKHVDNLMFCLSKGLSCPIGSLVVGDQDFIERARKIRKVLGGGMRQAGIIAAPGIIALEKMVDRLEEDHRNARRLAEGLSEVSGISVDLRRVQTNIVHIDVKDLGIKSEEFVSRLKIYGILALTRGKTEIRMVTHRGVEARHIVKTINIVKDISELSRKSLKLPL